ncbi:hypothetical protein SH584_08815 [Sphingomonas sp. LY29]|uniref:hypothetical protein n=1 Tax=Sphingomonas sp. LY29 TaxID=3095341 RepID=UPI002D79AC56|nr:hypothetical protein [Sphingomonas sp. LY29]WRP25149.1 hypothetical protein SH584_08815 [Sphingomonas sp. LY29]
MRKVDRKTVADPASLSGEQSAGGRELMRAREHHNAVPPKERSFEFAAYKGDDVRHALEKLFFCKCAYCETRYDITGPVDIEHFRPKNEVEGEGKIGYWWLAMGWHNLLPSCIDCNRRRYQLTPVAMASLGGILEVSRTGFESIKTGKQACFPISGTRVTAEPDPADVDQLLAAEKAILLDPCLDVPSDHLNFYINRDDPIGVVFAAAENGTIAGDLPLLSPNAAAVENAARAAGISVRGAVSIQIYGLNRLALVQERTRVLRSLEFLADTVINLYATADKLRTVNGANASERRTVDESVSRLESLAERAIAQINLMAADASPFSTMAKTWIKSFRADLTDPQRAIMV